MAVRARLAAAHALAVSTDPSPRDAAGLDRRRMLGGADGAGLDPACAAPVLARAPGARAGARVRARRLRAARCLPLARARPDGAPPRRRHRAPVAAAARGGGGMAL